MSIISTAGKIDLLPDTNENQYELLWAVREVIINNIITESQNNFNEALNKFLFFEANFSVKLDTQEVFDKDSRVSLGWYLTGKCSVIKATAGNDTSYAMALKKSAYNRTEYLSKFIEDDVQFVVELGCGWGLNLLLLHEIHKEKSFRYIGAEYTDSGRRIFRKFSELRKNMNPRIEHVDHRTPNLDFLSNNNIKPKKILIFTCHSIEQVDYLPDNYFQILSGAAQQVRGIHLEPFGFQVDCRTVVAKAHRKICEEHKYNMNFHEQLTKAESSGILKIKQIELNKFEPHGGNPTSVAIWQNY